MFEFFLPVLGRSPVLRVLLSDLRRSIFLLVFLPDLGISPVLRFFLSDLGGSLFLLVILPDLKRSPVSDIGRSTIIHVISS